LDCLLIKDGHIIDTAQGIDEITSLLITEGKIAWLGKGQVPSGCEVLRADGLVVCPGFIDLHCHLREPGFEEKETIATGTRAAVRGGFTTVCCMPNTSPPLDSQAAVEYVKAKAGAEGVARVIPIGCVTVGRAGKALSPMAELAAAGVAGFSDDGDPVADAQLMQSALETARKLGRPVIDHCQDKTLAEGGVMNEGIVSRKLGLLGMPVAAEENMVARDVELARMTGGWVHIAHVSTEGSVELIRQAKDKGIHVTAEVTPAHLTLTEETVLRAGTTAKVNPPLRTRKDVQALIQGLVESTIDVIATDHAPHTEADKRGDFTAAAFGISGLETALGSLMTLVHDGQLTLHTLICRLTSNPARILGERYGKLGTLVPGALADIVLFDPDRTWLVDTSLFASKGKNTPLAGFALRGKVMATISAGKLVYKDNAVLVGA
jgi:dihydroorotase